MTTAFSRSLAWELRRNADSISQTFAQCEQTCLDVGARLGDAIPGLSDLAALFESLSQSLEGEEIRAAGRDLEAIAHELERSADELTEESGALADLVGLNRAIEQQISKLLASIRIINALVFNVKIEAASLNESGDDMSVFADGLQEIAQRAQRALDEYQTTHGKLFELLRASSDAQTGFQRSHQASLKSISAEIAESLGAVADRRREIGEALQEISAQSQQIGGQIGQCVVALQVGDSTRQRIEHVHQALGLSARNMESEGAATDADLGDVEPERLAARMCRLQALQLDGALDEFTREMGAVSVSLRSVADDAGALAGRGRSLFGAGGGGGGSFLEGLERKLEAARALVGQCRRARAVVDSATAMVGTTMADLHERTAGLSQIVVDVTIIGTNAVLKSSRIGDRGKGLNIIAQELRNYAARIVEGIQELPPALSNVVSVVKQFSEAGRAHDSERLASLDGRMTAAIVAFNSNGKEMTAALSRLGGEADSVRDLLKRAVAMLDGHEDIAATLRSAAAAVDELSGRIGDADSESPEIDASLDRLLRGNYTMTSERQIHDAFTGASDDLNRRSEADSAPEVEELAEACLF
jgi:chromosome segregation ATPase